MRILVVNAGSESVKLRIIADGNEVAARDDLGPTGRDYGDDLAAFVDDAGTVDAAGHRVVHGGYRLTETVRIDRQVREIIESVSELAPLHNRPALAGIDAVTRRLPGVPAFACFDTAFHAGMPAAATSYAVPSEWVTRWGIRRFGFHGLSCVWATHRAAALLSRPVGNLRLVVCHLGGGASVTAVARGKSVDTTMGFTPMEGLVMATRSGDVDPGVLLWALKHGLSTEQVEAALEHHSGLLGLSGGRSSDMRVLLVRRAEGDEAAGLAVSVYVHRLQAKVAAMMASTSGADALIFTGGVGENSGDVRAETCAGLGFLGVRLDENANTAVGDEDCDISATRSDVRALVVHAREDLQIANECRRALGGAGERA